MHDTDRQRQCECALAAGARTLLADQTRKPTIPEACEAARRYAGEQASCKFVAQLAHRMLSDW
jgi:hypothetical protein